MSYDLGIFAMDSAVEDDDAAVEARYYTNDCDNDGDEPDPRIAAFYAALRSAYPDDPELPEGEDHEDDNPWSDFPLHVGVDHVILHMRWSASSDVVLDVLALADEHRLRVWDQQGGMAYPHLFDSDDDEEPDAAD
jgi:hypothetical protein